MWNVLHLGGVGSSTLEIKVLFQVADISTHFCVLPLVPASNPASRGFVWRSVSVPWKFTQLSKAAFPPAWKAPHIFVPNWAWSFVRLSLVLSPWLGNSERAGLVLLLLCHPGIPAFPFSGKVEEVGSYTGRLLPQIFQHMHNKSLVWTTSSLCSSCQSTSWDPGSTSCRLAGHLSLPTSNLDWGPIVWGPVCCWSRDCSFSKMHTGMEFLEKYCSSRTDQVASRGDLGRLFGLPDRSSIFPPMCREGDFSCMPSSSSAFWRDLWAPKFTSWTS